LWDRATIHRRKEVKQFLFHHPRLRVDFSRTMPRNSTLRNMFGIRLIARSPIVLQRTWQGLLLIIPCSPY
jgi:hypothetical protein